MAKRTQSRGRASPRPLARRIRVLRKATHCLRLIKFPGRAHRPSRAHSSELRFGGGLQVSQEPDAGKQPVADARGNHAPEEEFCTLARVLTLLPTAARTLEDAVSQSPNGTQPVRSQLVSPGKLVSHWYFFRPHLSA